MVESMNDWLTCVSKTGLFPLHDRQTQKMIFWSMKESPQSVCLPKSICQSLEPIILNPFFFESWSIWNKTNLHLWEQRDKMEEAIVLSRGFIQLKTFRKLFCKQCHCFRQSDLFVFLISSILQIHVLNKLFIKSWRSECWEQFWVLPGLSSASVLAIIFPVTAVH